MAWALVAIKAITVVFKLRHGDFLGFVESIQEIEAILARDVLCGSTFHRCDDLDSIACEMTHRR
jgi:hypothetical protein